MKLKKINLTSFNVGFLKNLCNKNNNLFSSLKKI